MPEKHCVIFVYDHVSLYAHSPHLYCSVRLLFKQVNILLPIFFFTICLFLVVLPVFERPIVTLISVSITLSGIPVYFATIYWESKPKIYQNFIGEAEFAY